MYFTFRAASSVAVAAGLLMIFTDAPGTQEVPVDDWERPEVDLPVESEGPVSFMVDTGVFFDESGSAVVEVYVEAPYDELPFVRRGGGYVSDLEVVAIFRSLSGDQVGGDSWTREIWVQKYDETMDPEKSYLAIAKFTMPSGDYDLKLTCGGRGSNLTGVAWKRFKVPEPPDEGLLLSDVRLGSCSGIGQDQADTSSFVPSGRRSFGEDVVSICALVEAYSFEGVDAESLKVEAEARNEDGAVVWEKAWAVPRSKWETLLSMSVPMDSLAWGAYDLQLDVSAGDYEARMTRAFEVDETRIGFSMDFDRFMDLMSLVATEEEIQTLATLGGSERRAYIDEIWERRDPDRSTPRNEFKIRFFRRLKYAKANFQEGAQEGWQTDRGRVFIKNGPADRIDVRQGVVGSLSPDARLEIWYYDSTNTRYVFEDFGGTGQYTLVDVVQG